jgi:hypothetical protein
MPSVDLRTRFMKKVQKTGGHWIWTGAMVKGVGQIRDGRPRSARVVGYELFVGPVPPGRMGTRKCGISRCVKPQHCLFETSAECARRIVPRCPHGGFKTDCRPCMAKVTRDRYARHRAAGLCGFCDDQPAPGHALCFRHLERLRVKRYA